MLMLVFFSILLFNWKMTKGNIQEAFWIIMNLK